jgi:formylglycine-generating enzyme required for sulfatase activity
MKTLIQGCSLLLILGITAANAATEVPVKIDTVLIEAGEFTVGSDRAERESAYLMDEARYGHSATRKQQWYENEPALSQVNLSAFRIMKNLVTNTLYERFVRDTGHQAPDVDPKTWAGYKLIHPYKRTRQFAWRNQQPPADRHLHPVVMVSRGDAQAFASWLSKLTSQTWTLPTEQQWEKAARGTDGRWFPWGNQYNASWLNSHDSGPFTTTPVGQYEKGASPFGMLDAAGQVFEWTSTRRSKTRSIVKGGSWDDKGCGVCRASARHSRPDDIKHILVGFRLVTTP